MWLINALCLQVPIVSGENIIADGPVSETPLALVSGPRSVQGSAVQKNTAATSSASKIVHLLTPSDNCCLFTSVNFCVTNTNSERLIGTPIVTDLDGVKETRDFIAGIVVSDPVNFNEGVLGMTPEKYIQLIMQVCKQLELSALSNAQIFLKPFPDFVLLWPNFHC